MIDTDNYEWDSKCRLVVIDGELFQRGANGDYHISQQLHDKAVAQIVADAPLLLEEVKRLREVVDKQQMQYVNLETAYYNSPSETEISRQIDSGVKHVCGEVKRVLNEEIKRLREAIDNIAKGMDEDWRHWRNELEKVIE